MIEGVDIKKRFPGGAREDLGIGYSLRKVLLKSGESLQEVAER